MTGRLLLVPAACGAVVAVLLGAASSWALGGLALLAGSVTVAGAAAGVPAMVFAGALGAMSSAVVAAALGASSAVLVVASGVIWLGVESTWRALDRATLGEPLGGSHGSAAERVWLTMVATVLLGVAAVGLMVAALIERVPEQGVGPWILAMVVVLAAAGLAGAAVIRNRWRAGAVRGSGSGGRGLRTEPGRPG